MKLGTVDGVKEGSQEGVLVYGFLEGDDDGVTVGSADGHSVGVTVGAADGLTVGTLEGDRLG